jgi:hypothetical protein
MPYLVASCHLCGGGEAARRQQKKIKNKTNKKIKQQERTTSHVESFFRAQKLRREHF